MDKTWWACSNDHEELPKKFSCKSVERFRFESRFFEIFDRIARPKLAIFVTRDFGDFNEMLKLTQLGFKKYAKCCFWREDSYPKIDECLKHEENDEIFQENEELNSKDVRLF